MADNDFQVLDGNEVLQTVSSKDKTTYDVLAKYVFDGDDESLGAQADAAASAGGTGTVQAKLRLVTTQLNAIQTAVEVLDNIVSGSEAQVDVVTSALPTGAATEATLSAIQTAVEILDNIVSGSEAQVDIVTQPARDRTTDNVGAVADTDSLMQDTTVRSISFEIIDDALSGDNTILAAQGASNKIRVLSLYFVVAGAVTVRFEDGTGGTALSGQMQFAAAGDGIVLPYNEKGWFETSANTLLNMELSGAVSVDGGFSYVVVT